MKPTTVRAKKKSSKAKGDSATTGNEAPANEEKEAAEVQRLELEQKAAVFSVVSRALGSNNVTERMKALFTVARWSMLELAMADPDNAALKTLPEPDQKRAVYDVRAKQCEALSKLVSSAALDALYVQRALHPIVGKGRNGLSEREAFDVETIIRSLEGILSEPTRPKRNLAEASRAARVFRGRKAEGEIGDSDDVNLIARHVLDVLCLEREERARTLRARLLRIASHWDNARVPSLETLSGLIERYGKPTNANGLGLPGVVAETAFHMKLFTARDRKRAEQRIRRAIERAQSEEQLPRQPTPLRRPDGTVPFEGFGIEGELLSW